MNIENYTSPVTPTGEIEPGILVELAGTQRWIRLAMVVIGLLVALTIINVGVMISSGLSAVLGAAVIAPNALTVLFYIVLGVLLNRYASAIGQAVETGAGLDVETALARQRIFWKVLGIMTAVLLVGGVLAGVIGAVVAIVSQLKDAGIS